LAISKLRPRGGGPNSAKPLASVVPAQAAPTSSVTRNTTSHRQPFILHVDEAILFFSVYLYPLHSVSIFWSFFCDGLRFLHIVRHSCSIATLAHRSLHNQQAIFHYVLDPAARLINFSHLVALWTTSSRCTNYIFGPIPSITPSWQTAVRVLPLRRHRSDGSLTSKVHTRWLR